MIFSPDRKPCAFTLIELVVVIAIIAVLTVLLVPAFTNLRGASELTHAAHTIKGVLEQARTYARVNNTYTWVGFYEENGSTASTNPPTAGSGRLVISSVASVDGTTIYGPLPGAIDPARLTQVAKLVRIENLHLPLLAIGTGTGDTFDTRPALQFEPTAGYNYSRFGELNAAPRACGPGFRLHITNNSTYKAEMVTLFTPQSADNPTCIELFAGAGGLAIGAAKTGLKHLAVIERDDDCFETLSRNKRDGVDLVGDWPLLHDDVRDVDFTKWQDTVDIICGGPPCQPFSIGGLHLGRNDKRDMFPAGVRAIRDARPKAFVFENVRGLARPKFANYFEYTRLQLTYPQVARKKHEAPQEHFRRLQRIHSSKTGPPPVYQVTTHPANAADFGVPQRRQRIFIVGFRDDLGIQWNFPKPIHSQTALLRTQLSGEYWERNKVPKKRRKSKISEDDYLLTGFDDGALPWVTVRDTITGLGCPTTRKHRFENHTPQLGARIYPGHTGSVLDMPAKTLKAGAHGVPGGENMVVLDDGSVRYFTVRESARLQTFPDEFVFPNSWTENMRQLGNAVPCDLARVVVQSVIDAIAREAAA